MDTPTNSATASPGGGGPIAGGRHHPPPHNHENLVLATVGALPPADRLRTITRLLNGYEAATQENIDRVGRTLEELFGAQDGIHGVPLDVVRDFQAALQNVRLAPGVNRLALRIDIHRRGAGRRHQRRAAMAEMMREAEAEAEAEAERLVAQMLAMGRRRRRSTRDRSGMGGRFRADSEALREQEEAEDMEEMNGLYLGGRVQLVSAARAHLRRLGYRVGEDGVVWVREH